MGIATDPKSGDIITVGGDDYSKGIIQLFKISNNITSVWNASV